METVAAVALMGSLVLAYGGTARAQAAAGTTETRPAIREETPTVGEAAVVKVRGTIAAIDKANGTITFKGPQGRTLTLDVRDRSKLDAVKPGEPVVATYVEALAIRVKKAGTAMPGATMQESRITSKPGETPAGAVGREITLTGTVTGIDRKTQTVTIKGPRGQAETVKVKNGKHLDGVEPGDLVELTYTQALAIALDKPTK